jgi:hypothetical protein
MSAVMLVAVYAEGLTMRQAWSDRAGWEAATPVSLQGVGGAEAQPARLRARWNDERIFFEFVCCDRSVVSPGARDGLDHFKLGDVVEIFLGRAGQDDYAEVHATPAGKKAWYFFQGYRRAVSAPAAVRGIEVRAEKTARSEIVVASWEIAAESIVVGRMDLTD